MEICWVFRAGKGHAFACLASRPHLTRLAYHYSAAVSYTHNNAIVMHLTSSLISCDYTQKLMTRQQVEATLPSSLHSCATPLKMFIMDYTIQSEVATYCMRELQQHQHIIASAEHKYTSALLFFHTRAHLSFLSSAQPS
jgi:hypothetical protein